MFRAPLVRRIGALIAALVVFVYAASGVVPTGALTEGDGVTIYGEGTVATPRTRQWAAASWGSETSLPTASGTISRVIVKASPTRNEMVAGVINTSNVLTVFRWNGNTHTWSSEWSVSIGTDGSTPRFDIAYQQVSGKAMVFYSKNAAPLNELAYRIYDGTSWTSETVYDAVGTLGIIQYIRAEARDGTNEIAVAWGDASFDMTANYFNGTAGTWVGEPATALSTSLAKVGTATTLTTRSFDIAFEKTSGELLVCWGNNAVLDLLCQPRTAGAGGAWGTTATYTALPEEPTDFVMASEPGSDYIAYANASDNGADGDAAIWDGSTWGNVSNFDTTLGTVAAGTTNVAVAWTQSGVQSRAVVTYEDSLATGIDWTVFNKNTPGWAVQADYTGAPAPVNGNDRAHLLRPDPYELSELIVMVVDNNSDVFGKKLVFNGSTFAWSSPEPGSAVLEATASAGTGWAVNFAFNAHMLTGSLSADIVNSSGTPVGSPAIAMSGVVSGTSCQVSTGTLGILSERIRVANMTGHESWSLSIAPTGGATANWSSGTATYDFNDATSSGCADGADTDDLAGQLSVDLSGATLTPESGCDSSGMTLGSNSGFVEGTTDAITLATASSAANVGCYWDLMDIELSQQIPGFQAAGAYSIQVTITSVAF